VVPDAGVVALLQDAFDVFQPGAFDHEVHDTLRRRLQPEEHHAAAAGVGRLQQVGVDHLLEAHTAAPLDGRP